MIRGFSIKATIAAAIVAAVISLLFVAGQASARPAFAGAAQPSGQSIADIAIASDDFNTLVTALSCTDLVGAVDGNRQLTVFAPTDTAFANAGFTADNICDVDEDVLSGILLYHVINGRRTSNSVLAAPSYNTLSGERLTQGELVLNAGLIDISARNGVMHVIDKVLFP